MSKNKVEKTNYLKGWQIFLVSDGLFLVSLISSSSSIIGSVANLTGFVTLIIALVIGILNILKKKTNNISLDIAMTIIATMIFCLVMYSGSQNKPITETNTTQNSSAIIETALGDQAAKMNEGLPRKMNETITMNSVSAKDKKLTYHLSFTPDVDEQKLSNETLKSPLVGEVCLNEDSKLILDQNVIFEYDFKHLGSGNHYKTSISKYDC